LSLRDSLDCLREAINAISIHEDGSRIELSIKNLILIANNKSESNQINDLLKELAEQSQQTAVAAETQNCDQLNSQLNNKLTIQLSPEDYISDSHYGKFYLYLRDGTLPENEKTGERHCF
jgi:protein subunit release factor A